MTHVPPTSSPFTDLPLAGFADADDPRTMPCEAALLQLGGALASELLDLLLGSALEDHVSIVTESLIGGLHTAALRLERLSDRSRESLARGLREFDGSEVADHDLQAARAATATADAAVRAVELIRDAAAEAYATATGETWSPWRGGVRPSVATAAQIDAQHALRCRETAAQAASDPGREVVVFRGAPAACAPDDARRIFDALNWAREAWPQMSLALTGAPGAEQLAKRWAQQKRVRLVLARPDFAGHGRAAPFRANDTLLALEPVCVLSLARSLCAETAGTPFGPVLHLAEQARARGLKCVRIGPRPPPA